MSKSLGDDPRVRELVTAMQALESIAISEAFITCHRLKIEKSDLLQVLRYGSAMSNQLADLLSESGEGKFFPASSMTEEWENALKTVCQRAREADVKYTLPQTAIASMAALASELEFAGSEDGFASLKAKDKSTKKEKESSSQSEKNNDKIVVIGIGLMGIGIALQLSKQTNTVGYDIDDDRMQEFKKKSGQVGTDLAKDCEDASYIVIVVQSAEQIHEILFDGDNPISKHLKSGATIIIHSTVPPGCAEEAQKRMDDIQKDVTVLDAPMSGTPAKAEDGKLLVVIGGPAEHVEKYEPYLRCYTEQILRFSTLGLASHLKLVHNTVAGINLIAATYTMKLGSALGIDSESLYQYILDSRAKSTYFEDRTPRILSSKDEASATLGIWLKDLSLALEHHSINAYFSPLLAYALESYRMAAAAQGEDAGDHKVYNIW